LALVAPAAPVAQAAGQDVDVAESVMDLAQDAVLDHDGSITINTKIDYEFGTTAPHELTYDIPLSYADDQGREYRTTFALLPTSTVPAPRADVDPHRARIKLPVYEAAGSIRTYQVHYKLQPIILTGPEGDIFRMNVTGPGWGVPIQQASFHIDSSTPLTDDLACVTGRGGQSSASCSVDVKGKSATVTSYAPLDPGDGLTVLGNFAGHSFTSYLTAYDAHPWQLPLMWIVIAALILGALAVPVVFIIRRRRYTKNHETSAD
jgi:hypothetical protein